MPTQLPPIDALTQPQAADYIKRRHKLPTSERTLRALASKGEGPPRHVMPNGRVFYIPGECDRWAYSQYRIDISFRASQLEAA